MIITVIFFNLKSVFYIKTLCPDIFSMHLERQ